MARILLTLIAALPVVHGGSATAQESGPVVLEETFDGVAIGSHRDFEVAVGRLVSGDRHLRVAPLHPVDAPDDLLLQLTGRRGEKGPFEVVWELPAEVRGGEVVVFDAD